MEAWIAENLSVYGPWLVFGLLLLSGIGIPLGEEMVTIPAGVLIAQGRLEYLPIVIAGYCGIVIADLMWFHICRTLGTRLLHLRWSKRLFHPRRILQAKHQLDHRGIWVIVMARFIPSRCVRS
jgi:membrane-associated protein